jgi:hypothetical protein
MGIAKERARVVLAVARMNKLVHPGAWMTPTEASTIAKRGMPPLGCGPATVAHLLVKNHGWMHEDRMLYKPLEELAV